MSEETFKANILGLGSSYRIIKNEVYDRNYYTYIAIPYVEVPDTPIKKYGMRKFIFNNLNFSQINRIINSKVITASITINSETNTAICTLEDDEPNPEYWVAAIKGCGYILPMIIESVDEHNVSTKKTALSVAYNKNPKIFEAVIKFKPNEIIILNNLRYKFDPTKNNYFKLML